MNDPRNFKCYILMKNTITLVEDHIVYHILASVLRKKAIIVQ